jgi:hypothetical protein
VVIVDANMTGQHAPQVAQPEVQTRQALFKPAVIFHPYDNEITGVSIRL